MANLSKLVLPVKNQSTGEVTNQEFDLPLGEVGTLRTRLSSYINIDTGKTQFYNYDLSAIQQNLLVITDSSYYGEDRHCPEPEPEE